METHKPSRVLTCYYRPKPGGFCTRYFRAINALLTEGCEVHYLAVVRFPIEHSKCVFHRFPWPQEKTDSLLFWGVFHIFSPFILLYLGIRWRITHCFAFGTTYGFFLQPLRMIRKIPLVLFLRGDPIAHHRTNKRPTGFIWLESLIEGLAIHGVRIYSVSDILGKGIVARNRWLHPLSVTTLRNNIDPRSSVKGRLISSLPRIGCVGMLEPQKNQSLLIDVLYKLDNETITLDVFGVGPDRCRLQSKAEQLGVISQINFRGWIDSHHVWKEIDLLLMPSSYEGCPNAILEAMGNFIPVLASDIPAHREILPTPNLLSIDDSDAWCIRLKRMVEHPEREIAFLIESQSERMQSMVFDWNKHVCDAIIG